MEKNHRHTTGFSVRSTAPITTEQYWSFFDTVRKSTWKILVYTNSMHAQGIMTCHYSFRCTTTLLPSSNSGKSMKRNELTLLVSGKIALKVSVLSKAIYIYIRVLAQVHVLQGTASCAAGMVTTVGINHAICAGK